MCVKPLQFTLEFLSRLDFERQIIPGMKFFHCLPNYWVCNNFIEFSISILPQMAQLFMICALILSLFKNNNIYHRLGFHSGLSLCNFQDSSEY